MGIDDGQRFVQGEVDAHSALSIRSSALVNDERLQTLVSELEKAHPK